MKERSKITNDLVQNKKLQYELTFMLAGPLPI